jgi:lipoprotein-anchoring transpeptidase ErfK/SrfK
VVRTSAIVVSLGLVILLPLSAAPQASPAQAAVVRTPVLAPQPEVQSLHRHPVSQAVSSPQVNAPSRPKARQTSFLLVEAGGAMVHRWPGGPASGTIPATTQLGTPTWAWAVSASPNGSWGRVMLPGLPNNRTGWIHLTGLTVRHTTWWVRATLHTHRLLLLNGRRMVAAFPIGVGAPASPTPTGRYNVTDLVNTGDPSGPFGWYAFGLSGHQSNLPAGWSGGTQLAIHGTNIPGSIGANQSAGCLHLTATALAVLKAHLILGSPVVIRP